MSIPIHAGEMDPMDLAEKQMNWVLKELNKFQEFLKCKRCQIYRFYKY
jgi:hypothetical protein